MFNNIFSKFNFKTKVLAIQIAVVLFVSAAIGVVFYNIFSNFVGEESLKEAKVNYRILNLLLDKQKEQLLKSAEMVSTDGDIIPWTKYRNKKKLNSLLSKSTNDQANIFLVVDREGKVIAGQKNINQAEYKLSIDSAIQKVFKTGETLFSYEVLQKDDLLKEDETLYNMVKMDRQETPGYKKGYIDKKVEEDALVNTVIVPIKEGKNVIGAVVSATIMNRNYNVIDNVKLKQEGIDFTIFKDDLRISTTVPGAQGRATGTLLSEKVVDEVLVKGKEYNGIAMVAGIPYMSYYNPIKDSSDKTIGILFSAVSVKKINDIIINKFGYSFLAVVGIIILLFIPVSFYITRKLMAPMQGLKIASEKMASGDFSFEVEEIPTNDELGDLSRSFKQMSYNMKKLITDIKARSIEVFNASVELQDISETSTEAGNQIADAIEQIATGTQDQAEEVSERVQDISEIASATQHILNEVKNITGAVNNSVNSAEKGQLDVQNSINKITEIRETTSQIASQMETLGQLGKEIGKIVDFITNIASQTNLLALNAAIESARAGEHGKGFAVVAEEVKKLADESSHAANQIKDMVGQIQKESLKSVENTKAGVILVNEGVEAVGNLKLVLECILKDSKDSEQKALYIYDSVNVLNEKNDGVSALMENISAASEESAASTEEITASVAEHHNSMETLSNSAAMLSDLTKQLNNTLSMFKI